MHSQTSHNNFFAHDGKKKPDSEGFVKNSEQFLTFMEI